MRWPGVLALAFLVPAGTARGDQDQNAVIASGGLDLGLGLHGEGVASGLVLGGEVSLVAAHFDRAEEGVTPYAGYGIVSWLGLYGDLVRDFGSDTTRLSAGPEVGHELAGIDGGLLVESGDDARWGVSGRLVGTIGVLAMYARWGHFFDDLPDDDFAELGLLITFPYPLFLRAVGG